MGMRAGVAVMSVVLLACPGRGQESAQAGNERAVLEQILTQSYQPSVVGKQVMGVGTESAVRRAGVIVVVQRPGLYASLERKETTSTAIHGLDAEVFRGNKDYAIPVGERFYVTAIHVGGETVFFGLLSARSVTAPKGAGRVWAATAFYFPAETLATADKDTVFRSIDPWFVPEGRSGVSGAPTAAVSAAPAAPPPAPQQPAAAPQDLTPGMTREQVVAALGAPQREISFGGQSWLTYPGMMVVLKDGKLTSIDAAGQPPARVAIHSDPAGAEIYLEGQLAGSTPSTLDLPAGNHQISVRLSGYQEWARDLRVLAGSEISLDAKLEKK
jgi:hypothetical protein